MEVHLGEGWVMLKVRARGFNISAWEQSDMYIYIYTCIERISLISKRRDIAQQEHLLEHHASDDSDQIPSYPPARLWMAPIESSLQVPGADCDRTADLHQGLGAGQQQPFESL